MGDQVSKRKTDNGQKGPGVVEHIFNPNTGKAEANGSMRVPDQPGQNSETCAVHVYVCTLTHAHTKQKFKSFSNHPANRPVKSISFMARGHS